jgi:FHS family L-fucose permease-like MFS transporter
MVLFTAAAAAMCLYVLGVGGVSAGFVALAIGVTNSIMFPVIFTLTLERSTASPAATSGMLCTCIIGGAVLPPLTGLVAGSAGYGIAFIVPAICYSLLSLFSMAAAAVPARC